MKIILNGETKEWAEAPMVSAMLVALGVDARKVAVEINRVIIPKSRYESHVLAEGDVVEIVGFIGGG